MSLTVYLLPPVLLFYIWRKGSRLLKSGKDPKCLFKLPAYFFLLMVAVLFAMSDLYDLYSSTIVVSGMIYLLIFMGLWVAAVRILTYWHNYSPPMRGGKIAIFFSLFSFLLVFFFLYMYAYPFELCGLCLAIISWRKGDPYGIIALAILIPVCILTLWATVSPAEFYHVL